MTRDRAVQRYFQVTQLEVGLKSCEDEIARLQQERDELDAKISAVRTAKNGLLKDLRRAAADDPQLELPMWSEVPAAMKAAGLALADR